MLTFLKQHVTFWFDYRFIWLFKNDNAIIVICLFVFNGMIMIVLIKLVLLLEYTCLWIHVFFFPFFFILFWYGRYYFLRYIVIDLIWCLSDLVLLFHQQILSTLCIIFRHFLRLLFMPVLYEIDLLLLLLLRFLNSSGIGSFDLWLLFCGRCCIDNLSNFTFLKLPSLYRFLNLLLRRFRKLLGKNLLLIH